MSTKFTTNSLATADHRRRFAEIVGEENVEINFPLSKHFSVGLGGVAEIFIKATSNQHLVDAAKAAIELKIPYQLVAAGTGTLPSDVGFPGLIIENRANSFFFADDSRQLVADSGVDNSTVVMAAANQNLGGIEFLVAIPGTIGGAVATSAAYGGKTLRNQCLKEIVVFIPNVSGGEVVTIPAQELENQPYEKIFTQSDGFQPIILSIKLQLARLSQYEILDRLRELRRHIKHQASFGKIFKPEITELPRGIQLPKTPEGISYNLKEPNSLYVSSSKGIKAGAVREYIEQLVEFYREVGLSLDARVNYLGYWPKENETHLTNSESI